MFRVTHALRTEINRLKNVYFYAQGAVVSGTHITTAHLHYLKERIHEREKVLKKLEQFNQDLKNFSPDAPLHEYYILDNKINQLLQDVDFNLPVILYNTSGIIPSPSDNKDFLDKLAHQSLVKNTSLPDENRQAILEALIALKKNTQQKTVNKHNQTLTHHNLLMQVSQYVYENRDRLKHKILLCHRTPFLESLLRVLDALPAQYTVTIDEYSNHYNQHAIFQHKILSLAAMMEDSEKYPHLYNFSVQQAIAKIKNNPFYFLEMSELLLSSELNKMIEDDVYKQLIPIVNQLREINALALIANEGAFESTADYRELYKLLLNFKYKLPTLPPNNWASPDNSPEKFLDLQRSVNAALTKTERVIAATEGERAYRAARLIDPTAADTDETPTAFTSYQNIIEARHNEIPLECLNCLKILWEEKGNTIHEVLNAVNLKFYFHKKNATTDLSQQDLFEMVMDFISHRISAHDFEKQLENMSKDDKNYAPLYDELIKHMIPPTYKNKNWSFKTWLWSATKQLFRFKTPIEKTIYDQMSWLNLSWLIRAPYQKKPHPASTQIAAGQDTDTTRTLTIADLPQPARKKIRSTSFSFPSTHVGDISTTVPGFENMLQHKKLQEEEHYVPIFSLERTRALSCQCAFLPGRSSAPRNS